MSQSWSIGQSFSSNIWDQYFLKSSSHFLCFLFFRSPPSHAYIKISKFAPRSLGMSAKCYSCNHLQLTYYNLCPSANNLKFHKYLSVLFCLSMLAYTLKAFYSTLIYTVILSYIMTSYKHVSFFCISFLKSNMFCYSCFSTFSIKVAFKIKHLRVKIKNNYWICILQ